MEFLVLPEMLKRGRKRYEVVQAGKEQRKSAKQAGEHACRFHRLWENGPFGKPAEIFNQLMRQDVAAGAWSLKRGFLGGDEEAT